MRTSLLRARARTAGSGLLAWLATSAPSSAQPVRAFELEAPVENDWFGRVEWVGDLDGDGFDDFLVGSPEDDVDLDGNGVIGWDERSVGRVRLYSGRRVGAALRTWHGDAGQENFGAEMALLGDLDGDGVREFAVAAPSTSITGQHAYVRVFSGGAILDPQRPARLGDLVDGDDRDGDPGPDGKVGDFGAALCDAGDVDRDGTPDVLVAGGGEYRFVVLFSGATLQPLQSWDLHPVGKRPPKHPTAVASFGRDVTGDKKVDLVFGNYAASDGSVKECGTVWLVSGTSAIAYRKWYGAAHHDWLGYALHVVPDLTGDAAGKPELLAGAPGTYSNAYGADENGNYVVMWRGEELATAGRVLRGESIGAAPGSFFGGGIDSGDFLPGPASLAGEPHELFVSARHHDAKRGRIGAFRYDAASGDWQPLWSVDGRSAGDKLGRMAARGRLTADAADPSHPDAGDELLLGTAHGDGPAGGELGRVWCLTSAAGAIAEWWLEGDGWAGDDADPSAVPDLSLASLPVPGTTVRVEVRCDLPDALLGMLLLGTGNEVNPALPHLLVSDFVALPFLFDGARGSIDVAVPEDPSWFTSGARWYAQALVAADGVPGGVAYSACIDAIAGGAAW